MFQEGPGFRVLWTWSIAAKLLRQCGHQHKGAERRALGRGRGWAANAPPLTAIGHLRERLPSPRAGAVRGSPGGAEQGPRSLTPPISQESWGSRGPHPQSPEPTRGRPRCQHQVLGRQQAPATEGTSPPTQPTPPKRTHHPSRPHEGRSRSGWEAAGRQHQAGWGGAAWHWPRTPETTGLGWRASRPYHLLSNVDVGLSKGLWQELLPERVHCRGVDGNQGHHACNARATSQWPCARAQGTRLTAARAGLLPWTTSDPWGAAGTSAEPDSQTWGVCPHRPLPTTSPRAHQVLACRAQGSTAPRLSPTCPNPVSCLPCQRNVLGGPQDLALTALRELRELQLELSAARHLPTRLHLQQHIPAQEERSQGHPDIEPRGRTPSRSEDAAVGTRPRGAPAALTCQGSQRPHSRGSRQGAQGCPGREESACPVLCSRPCSLPLPPALCKQHATYKPGRCWARAPGVLGTQMHGRPYLSQD